MFDDFKPVKIVRESLRGISSDLLSHTPFIIAGFAILVITYLLSNLYQFTAGKFLARTELRASLKSLFLQLGTVTIWICGILMAATAIFPGVTPSKILTVLGLGSVAIGFAFKDIFENFLAGVLILWKFPFDPGDFIECNGMSGKVEDISIRMTSIRQTDGQLVVVPNALLFKEPVNVLTEKTIRRITVICGVAYGEDLFESRNVIKKAVEGCKSVSKQKPIEIFAQEFASSSINFEITWWTGATPLDQRRSRDEIIEAVKKALDQAEIEIPFPYRTLTFKEHLKVYQTK